MNNYDLKEKFKKQVSRSFKEIFGIDIKGYHLIEPKRRQVAIKHDGRFLQTNNLFIAREGRKPTGEAKRIGIYNRNFAILVIGTINHFYLFSTDTLVEYYNKRPAKLVKGALYSNGWLQYGSLLPVKVAKQLCISHIIIDNHGVTAATNKLF